MKRVSLSCPSLVDYGTASHAARSVKPPLLAPVPIASAHSRTHSHTGCVHALPLNISDMLGDIVASVTSEVQLESALHVSAATAGQCSEMYGPGAQLLVAPSLQAAEGLEDIDTAQTRAYAACLATPSNDAETEMRGRSAMTRSAFAAIQAWGADEEASARGGANMQRFSVWLANVRRSRRQDMLHNMRRSLRTPAVGGDGNGRGAADSLI